MQAQEIVAWLAEHQPEVLEAAMAGIAITPPSYAVEICADKSRYRGGFTVLSSDGSKTYKISFDMALEAWVCSCWQSLKHGQCKHLTAADRLGWKHGRQPEVAVYFGNF